MTSGASFGWQENAGLMCVWVRRLAVHVGVRRDCWSVGLHSEWYDGDNWFFGLGPFFLVTWWGGS